MIKFLTAIFVLGSFTAFSYEDDIFIENQEDEEEFFLDIEKVEHGGFGAFVLKTAPAAGNTENIGLMIGGRGGWIINHTISIGAGAYTQVAGNVESEYIDQVTGNNLILRFTQVGFELEFIKSSNSLIHYTILMHIGAGNLQYSAEFDIDEQDRDQDYNPDYGSDWFFQFEPSVNVELNITKWFRFQAGIGYRFTKDALYKFESGDIIESYNSNDLNGFSANFHFKFGKF